MRGIAVFAVLGVAACAEADANLAAAPVEMQGWQMASGRAPSKSEFAAVVAACEGQAVSRSRGKPLDTCLGDLGLRRTP